MNTKPKTNELGKTGIFVTRVGMGVLTVGYSQLNLPIADGAAVVTHALNRGINFLDTAQYYRTYPYIKEALKGRYDLPVISTKSGEADYFGMAAAVDEARAELDIDEIDIFLMHEVSSIEDFYARDGAWECLNDVKARCIVKAIGISTHYTEVAELCATLPEVDVLFALINKAGMGIRSGSGFGSREDMETAIARNSAAGKGIYAMKALGGGNIAADYVDCLDYVNRLPGIDSIMVGLGTTEEADRLADYATGALDPAYKPDVSQRKIRIDRSDCEGCGSCIKVCPNKAISFDKQGLADVNHELCIKCGYCAPACPVRAIILL